MRKTISILHKAISAPVAATRDAFAERLETVHETACLLYNRMVKNMEYGRQRLKDIVKKEAEEEAKEQQQEEKGINLTPHEHERALKGAYRSFVIRVTPKAYIDSYTDQVKPHIETLIEDQLKEMQSAKIITILCVRLKKPVRLAIKLDPEDVEVVQDIGGNTGDNYIRVEIPFTSLMTEFFEGTNTPELIQRMSEHIKTQVENPRMPESGFITLDQIMHLHINFHRLALTQGSSYIMLPEWMAKKKAVINPKNNDEKCFKWGAIAALHHEDTKHHPERIDLLQHYEDQNN